MSRMKDYYTDLGIYEDEIKQLKKENKDLRNRNKNLMELNHLLYGTCGDLIDELTELRYERDGK
jgi:cell division protein FtsB